MKKKTKHGFIFGTLLKLFKVFKTKPTIYNFNDDDLEQGIIVSNHSAASGPLTLSLYYPIFFIPWGTYEMTGNYKMRWNYLYHIFYQQKLGYGKFRAFIIATLFAVISKMLYNGMQLIATYPNTNFRKTIANSIEHLKLGNSILIFPEDSNTGYHEHLVKYNNGFAYLSESYYKETNINLPIYPMYFHKILNSMIIGKKVDIKELRDKGMTRTEIADYFKDLTNELGEELFRLEREKKTYNEKVVFGKRLKAKIQNIRSEYKDISINSFKFLKNDLSVYKDVMLSAMNKKDTIINKTNLTVRYYSR